MSKASKRPAQASRQYRLADNPPIRRQEEYDDWGEKAFTFLQPSWEGWKRVAELQPTGARVFMSAK